jgi:hypothetical protein
MMWFQAYFFSNTRTWLIIGKKKTNPMCYVNVIYYVIVWNKIIYYRTLSKPLIIFFTIILLYNAQWNVYLFKGISQNCILHFRKLTMSESDVEVKTLFINRFVSFGLWYRLHSKLMKREVSSFHTGFSLWLKAMQSFSDMHLFSQEK